jgi:hypothetical protein
MKTVPVWVFLLISSIPFHSKVLRMEDNSILSDWQELFLDLSSFLRSAERQLGLANQHHAEYVVDRLEMFIVTLSSLVEHIRLHISEEETVVIGQWYCSHLSELLSCLRVTLRQWVDYLDHWDGARTSYSVPIAHSNERGRPKFGISEEQLLYLRSLSFTWIQIAKILGVSVMTIYRRRQEFGLEEPSTTLRDGELHQVLLQLRREFPNLGQTLVWGLLRSLGYKVTRSRVRQAILNTDPINSARRWRQVTSRRSYSVPGPNSLWHLGN